MESPVGRNRWVQALLVLFLVLGSVPNAFANLCVFPTEKDVFCLLISLLAEAVFLALILIPRGFRWVRMVFAWLMVTTLTWVGLMVFLFVIVDLVARVTLSGVIPTIVAGEVMVIVVEAVILKYLSATKSFRMDGRPPLRITSALGYSFLANAVSLVAGIGSYAVASHLFGVSRPHIFPL